MRDMVQVRRPSGNMFAEVPAAQIPRSQFDRSHGLKTAFEADDLVPIFVEEVLPGDTFTCRMHGMARIFSPLKAPIMDNLTMDVHFFYVPWRLVWTNWEKFCGAQTNPGDSTDYTVPVWSSAAGGYNVSTGSLGDFLGLPYGLSTANVEVVSLYHRAYWAIYNAWYRDENLVSSVAFSTGDGPDTGSAIWGTPGKRAKRHDYFTSCLPWPQKGAAVALPLGTQAPVYGIGKKTIVYPLNNQQVYDSSDRTTFITYPNAALIDATGDDQNVYIAGTGATGYPDIYADLSVATAATINELRQAFQIQKLLERDARGGTRYIEILRSHFGVTSPDFRLQRPEFLGGGKTFINISPVANTSDTATAAQGKLAGVGTAALSGIGFAKSFVEHGCVLGIASVRADLTYQQGLRRQFSRQTRYDFYWPALATIGEQAVLKKEIFVSGVPATDDAVFGYQERYAEYRYCPSRVSGKFRSDAPASLDLWHLAEDFAAAPSLNSTFITSTTPMSRVQAVTTEPDFILDAWFDLKCARPMPLFGVPGMIDHF